MNELQAVFNITQLTFKQAEQIVKWKYNAPYCRYNMEDCSEDIEELMDGSYYSVCNELNEIVGFFCFGKNAQVKSGNDLGLYDDKSLLDIGLGMRPDLTGKGNGTMFLQAGIDFAYTSFAVKKLRLSVASFNTRAISLYEKLGFIQKTTFINRYGVEHTPFILMEKSE